METLRIELSDGSEVELRECWGCCNGIKDCGSYLEVYDVDNNDIIGCIENATLPDTDDEDFDLKAYSEEIEELLRDF